MKKYSANYSNTNHNFVIQNISDERAESIYSSSISILKNILQRGCPTIPSQYILSKIGNLDLTKYIPLISNKAPVWERIIRGDVKNNYYPAQIFFDKLIPKYFSDYPFVQQLIVPEVPINYITQIDVDEFQYQQVDFYLPQAFMVIEIDGAHHSYEADTKRDNHLKKFGIDSIRLTTEELQSENDNFLRKIDNIKNRIDIILKEQLEYKTKNPVFFTFEDYKTAIIDVPNLNENIFKATSILRFQIAILELMDTGKVNFEDFWDISVFDNEQEPFEDIAIQDLFIWFEHLLNLQHLKFIKPEIKIKRVSSFDELKNSKSKIKIDFSLTKRYTDEFQNHPEIIFIRTDYFEYFRYYKNTNSVNPLYIGLQPINHFQVSTSNLVNYNIAFGERQYSERILLFFMKNIFGYTSFFPGQLSIIINALNRNDTIGLLPTGGGKSVCYQLAILLQPGVGFVVCPIKSLMYDQKQDLESSYITRVNLITGDIDGEDKERVMKEFATGKYLFIFISPERFQIKSFRQYLLEVNNNLKISYAVIDEVHCLSEWGHDFRTSYLNLSDTISRFCTNFRFIGLTATASINVLNDIKIEFGIKQENVKTLVDYTRKELDFEVLNDHGDKLTSINNLLRNLNETENIFALNDHNTKCGIIFTPHVNGPRGCFNLANSLKQHFNTTVKYYSGSIPKKKQEPIMAEKEFEELKQNVQKQFKQNSFPLLTATKAFGMGVNKGNIHYTIHYGIPASMESLYQEAGRAGRDKIKFSNINAKCYVLLGLSDNEELLNQVWDRNTTLPALRDNIMPGINGDVNANLFLFTNSLDSIKDEYNLIINLVSIYGVPLSAEVKVFARSLNSNKAKVEKAIYRLKQLGIIKDWTITNFFNGEFQVDFCDYNDESIKDSLLKTIHKYDKDFNLKNFENNEFYLRYQQIWNNNQPILDKCIVTLLQWAYSHFAYNRIQSLKNIYENCNLYLEQRISKEEFKKRLEDYFRFSEVSFVLQHIAENPTDFSKWFLPFYQYENNKQSNKIINREQIQSLLANLSRFLESYQYNVGLDLVSGLLRLLLNDFENSDGRSRFDSSLKQIIKYNHTEIEYILTEILEIGTYMSGESKNKLAEMILNYFPDDLLVLKKVQKSIEDQFSTSLLLSNFTTRLKNVNNNIYAGFNEIR